MKDFNEFARNRKNCHVAENGFLFWKIMPDKASFPCTLSGGGCQMIVHIMVLEGEMTIAVGVKTYVINRGVYVHLIDCPAVELLSASEDLTAYLLCNTDRYTAMLLKNAHPIPFTLVSKIREQPLDQLTPEATERIRHRMECIEEVCRNGEHTFRNEMVKCALWMHLMEIADIYIQSHSVQSQTNRRKEIFVTFMDMLPRKIAGEHTVSFYAAALCVTPQYLNRIVRAYTGKTVYEWICNTLVGELTKRLEETNDTMQQIAADFHFPDQATLAKFYKRQTGYSLTEYRKGLAAK